MYMPAAAAAAISAESLVHSFERIPPAAYDMPLAAALTPLAIMVPATCVQCQCDAAASPRMMRGVNSWRALNADPASRMPSSLELVSDPLHIVDGELPPGLTLIGADGGRRVDVLDRVVNRAAVLVDVLERDVAIGAHGLR